MKLTKAKTKVLFLVAVATLFMSKNLFAQPTIIFDGEGGVLTLKMVNAILEEEGLGNRTEIPAVEEFAEEFYAIIINATKIESEAFRNCTGLISVELPEGLTIIGGLAFYDCIGLQQITFPTTLDSIYGSAFFNCQNMQSVETLLAVKSIAQQAFFNCRSMQSILLPRIQNIGMSAFSHCYGLTSITIGSDFEEETEVEFGFSVFGIVNNAQIPSVTPNIDLILCEYVLPAPNMEAMTWQTDNLSNPYTWKSITIEYISIKENSIATHFQISPNPTSADAIASFGLLESGEITIEICDMLGNVIYTVSNFYDAGEHTVSIDTKGFPSGTYICRLLSKGKQIATVNFVVVR